MNRKTIRPRKPKGSWSRSDKREVSAEFATEPDEPKFPHRLGGKRKGAVMAHPGTLRLMHLRASGDLAWRDKVRAALVIENGSLPMAAISLDTDPKWIQRRIKEDPTLIAGISLKPPGWTKGRPKDRKERPKDRKVP